MSKIISFFMSIVMLLFPKLALPEVELDTEAWNTNYPYIMVHGLSGWGSYDPQYKLMPYWGMFGGDFLKNMNNRGFTVRAASVAPQGSAWDRACELYAQLAGTKTDYGKEHSERCGHDRYGKDFTGNALIEKWDSENKINILGHSFGGVTVRLLAELMANGSEAERAATPENELSPLFAGGKGDWIYSLTTLAAPHNGTTAYGLHADRAEDGTAAADTADHDMHIDNALAINDKISTVESVYYFSFTCSATEDDGSGNQVPINKNMETIFRSSSAQMGKITGTTDGGFVIDESWLENDGLVNTVSAKAPYGAPQKDYDPDNITAGIWNIMPTVSGDHMCLQGGLFKTREIRSFYCEFFSGINEI